jgi:AmiR/NasT family two-component response regulator
MRKKTRVLFIVSQRMTAEADYEHILAVLRDAGFELHDETTDTRPDVVLLDLPKTPRELSGMLSRATAARAPMIVMSRDAATLPRRARALGAYGFVQRPCQAQVLLERVGSAAEACRRHPTLFGIRRS